VRHDPAIDFEMELYAEDCSSVLAETPYNVFQVCCENATSTTMSVKLRVEVEGVPHCAGYELLVSSIQGPCELGLEDVNAPNHDCASAAQLAPGSSTELVTYLDTSEDFFAMDAPSGETWNVEVLFSDADGDIDVSRYQASTPDSTSGSLSDALTEFRFR
jgi:hypothetical protein